jgi:hypothetical protein
LFTSVFYSLVVRGFDGDFYAVLSGHLHQNSFKHLTPKKIKNRAKIFLVT